MRAVIDDKIVEIRDEDVVSSTACTAPMPTTESRLEALEQAIAELAIQSMEVPADA